MVKGCQKVGETVVMRFVYLMNTGLEILKLNSVMSKMTTLTVRLDAALKSKLEQLSKSTQRSQSWLAAEAIAAYVEQEAWQIQQIQDAVLQSDQPEAEWIAHEDVSAWLNTWGTEHEMPAPCP